MLKIGISGPSLIRPINIQICVTAEPVGNFGGVCLKIKILIFVKHRLKCNKFKITFLAIHNVNPNYMPSCYTITRG